MRKKQNIETEVKQVREKEQRESFSISRPTMEKQYKIIKNVAYNSRYCVTVENRPTWLEPNSDSILIPVDDFNRYLKNSVAIKNGIIIELDDNGGKIIVDNPNIMLDEEIDLLLTQSLNSIKKQLNKITSKQTLFRILNKARNPHIESGIAAAAQAKYDDVALPKGEPVLDLDQFARPRRAI